MRPISISSARSGWAVLAYLLCLVCHAAAATAARADSMDPELSRLRVPPGKGGCPNSGAFCPNDEAFERLVSDLAVSMGPPVGTGAASLGVRGFSLRLSTAVTPISGSHWVAGSAGDDPARDSFNRSPNGVLAWNRLEVHKGLPFGLEFGGSFGQGLDTSLWSFAAELRVALFEGFRSGLGALPDVAVRGAYQWMLGSSQMSLQTMAFDVTLSKPYVVAGRHQLTPWIAMQALFASAKTQPIDLTPDISAFDECAPQLGDGQAPGIEPGRPCSTSEGARDLRNTVRFADVNQTRIRLFLGAEERYGMFTGAVSFGFDLVVPGRSADTTGDRIDDDLARSVTLHIALGLRY